MYPHLFSPFKINGIELQNRLTMAPLYLGYAAEGGAVSTLLLDHYRLMAQSGVALVVVENSTIDHPAICRSCASTGGTLFGRNLWAPAQVLKPG
ncbi:MAG: hypothetical protein P8X58_14780 [Syntrophobacterales bacterium]